MSILAASLSFSILTVVPQVHCKFPHHAAVEEPVRPAAGARPGTERWVVLFKARSFDLSEYRAAVAAPKAVAAAAAEATLARLDAQMRSDQQPFVAQITGMGGRVVAQWWLVNGCAVEIEPGQVELLRQHPNVLRMHPDVVRQPGFIRTSTNAQNHATDLVQQQGVLGQGVTVASIDSGVDSDMNGTGRPHATFFVNGDINNRTGGGIGGSRLLANVQVGAMSPDDLIAHGTAVAGVMAGERWNNTAVSDRGQAPATRIVSYCVADDVAGGAWAVTLANAWAQLAQDRLRYGITVANCSYQGYFDMGFADQLAIEELARSADVVITGMAGNEGGQSRPQFGYGAVNMMAVGSVDADTRLVSPFSTRGPLFTLERRFYPDLVANGANMVLPLANAEGSQRSGSGTSYSAPQVAGAAALYRSLRPQANAREVKAAILAATEDVVAGNLTEGRQAYGVGYLRVDELVNVAAGRGLIANSSLPRASNAQTHLFAVQQGRYYHAALAWFRHDTLGYDLSDLKLEVDLGGTVLTSDSPANAYEVVRFRAPASGLVRLTARVVSMEAAVASLPYALVATETGRFSVPGEVVSFGISCGGTLTAPGAPPAIGASYTANCSPLANVSAVLGIGASRTTWLGLPLPLSLTGAGFPGCTVYSSFDLLQTMVRGASGLSATVALPNDPALVRAHLFHQVLVVGGIAGGLALTNALDVTIGGPQ